jgi:hypothetical protein
VADDCGVSKQGDRLTPCAGGNPVSRTIEVWLPSPRTQAVFNVRIYRTKYDTRYRAPNAELLSSRQLSSVVRLFEVTVDDLVEFSIPEYTDIRCGRLSVVRAVFSQLQRCTRAISDVYMSEMLGKERECVRIIRIIK